MTTVTGADRAATRDDPPDPTDYGLVVRVISDTGTASSVLLNGARTAITAVASIVLVANAIAPGDLGSRLTAIVYNAGAATIYVGAAGVTDLTGYPLVPGATIIFDQPNVYAGEIWAISGGVDSIAFAQELVHS